MVRIPIVILALVLPLLAVPDAGAQDDPDRARPFTPSWAAPQLDVSPRDGPPGEAVRITGAGFNEGVRVYYGPTPMRILRRSDERVVVEIPPGASGDRFIYVVDETGRARTADRFALWRRGPRHDDRRYDDRRYDRGYDDRRYNDRRYDDRRYDDRRYDDRRYDDRRYDDRRYDDRWDRRYDDRRYDDWRYPGRWDRRYDGR